MSFAAMIPMIMQMMQGGEAGAAPQMQGMPQQPGMDPSQMPPVTGQQPPDLGMQQPSQLDQERQQQAQMLSGLMRRQ